MLNRIARGHRHASVWTSLRASPVQVPGADADTVRVTSTALDSTAARAVSEPRPGQRTLVVTALVAALLGVALRIGLLTSVLGRQVDGDEAVAGLIARRLSQGEWHTFFWGQNYGGTLELILTGAIFRIGGTGVITLKLAPILLSAFSAVLVWRIGLRTVGRRAAVLAASLWWVFPPGLVWWSTKAAGFYWAGLCLALGIMLLALAQREEPTARGMVAIGMLGGLGWWTSPLVATIAAPTLVWLLVRQAGARSHLPKVIGAAVVGAAPWLGYNLVNGFTSFAQPTTTDRSSSYAFRFKELWLDGLPRLLGLRPIRGGGFVLGVVGLVVYLGLLVAFARLVKRWPRPVELLLVVAVPYPLLYALPQATSASEPRYLLFAGPVVALLLGAGFDRIVRRPMVALGTICVVAAFSALAFVQLVDDDGQDPAIGPPDPTPVVAALDRLGIAHAYSDHWIGYQIVFATQERILTDPISTSRWPEFDEAIGASSRVAWIVNAGFPLDRRLLDEWARLGVFAHREEIGRFVIYVPDRVVTPPELGFP